MCLPCSLDGGLDRPALLVSHDHYEPGSQMCDRVLDAPDDGFACDVPQELSFLWADALITKVPPGESDPIPNLSDTSRTSSRTGQDERIKRFTYEEHPPSGKTSSQQTDFYRGSLKCTEEGKSGFFPYS